MLRNIPDIGILLYIWLNCLSRALFWPIGSLRGDVQFGRGKRLC